MKHFSGVVLALAVVLLVAAMGSPCTVFSYSGDGVLLFGNSEDYDLLEPWIWFLPAREPFHGVLCLGFGGADRSIQGGMNDVGLCYDATGSTAMPLNWHKEKVPPPGTWLEMVLQRCATVDDVEAFIRRYDFSASGMAQYLWFDRNGDSLIVTSAVDGEVAFMKHSGGARVITNFNVTDPSVGFHPCWRYDTAELMLRRIEDGALSPTVATFRAILNGVHQPGYTAYSNVFDPLSRTAYVYRACDFRAVRAIDLADALAEGPPPAMALLDYFEATESQ